MKISKSNKTMKRLHEKVPVVRVRLASSRPSPARLDAPDVHIGIHPQMAQAPQLPSPQCFESVKRVDRFSGSGSSSSSSHATRALAPNNQLPGLKLGVRFFWYLDSTTSHRSFTVQSFSSFWGVHVS
jgi:hypothetical protein